MPIRLNLLAEVQAAEEIRRRDPVKRVIWIAALLVCVMLVWWSSLLVKGIVKKREINHIEGVIATRTNDYQVVLENQKKISDVTQKLAALQELATNRFLNGNLLNALQKTTVDGIRLMRMRIDQSYSFTEEVKTRTANGRPAPGKPATVAERIVLTMDGRASDSPDVPADLVVNKFRETVAANRYFKNFLGGTNEVRLTRYSGSQSLPGEQPFVLFTVQCASPEQIR